MPFFVSFGIHFIKIWKTAFKYVNFYDLIWFDRKNWSAAEYRYTYMIYFVRQDWYIKLLWFCHILNLIILALFILIKKNWSANRRDADMNRWSAVDNLPFSSLKPSRLTEDCVSQLDDNTMSINFNIMSTPSKGHSSWEWTDKTFIVKKNKNSSPLPKGAFQGKFKAVKTACMMIYFYVCKRPSRNCLSFLIL